MGKVRASSVILKRRSTPSDPAEGEIELFADTNGILKTVDDEGLEKNYSPQDAPIRHLFTLTNGFITLKGIPSNITAFYLFGATGVAKIDAVYAPNQVGFIPTGGVAISSTEPIADASAQLILFATTPFIEVVLEEV